MRPAWIAAVALAACTHAPDQAHQAHPAPAVGRAAPALVCPPGTAAVQLSPDASCSGRIFDYPAPRACAVREYTLCKMRFGTSEHGTAAMCHSTTGSHQERFQIREGDGSVIAEGTCRAGTVNGALYRWREGLLSEVIPMRDGVANGLYVRWEHGHVVDRGEFINGTRAPAGFACPAGTTAHQAPPEPPCTSRVFDFPGPRNCLPREYAVCSTRFGTSEGGSATTCRDANGLDQGPFQVHEGDGSVIAQGTCRAGVLDGVTYRWRTGVLTEAAPFRDGAANGVYLQWGNGHITRSAEFVEHMPVGEP